MQGDRQRGGGGVGGSVSLQGKISLALAAQGNLHSLNTLKTQAALKLIARQGTAQAPSGLGAKMTIITDPFRPDVIRDQYLSVWFNGHPQHCRIALKMDDEPETQPDFTWQNPGETHAAVIRIDSAAIAGDGKSHLIKVSVWQAVGNQVSTRATTTIYAKIPTVRPATQPAWCGATPIRQGETRYSAPSVISGHIGDLTRIDWRHTGAVQIMAKIPTYTKTASGAWVWKTRLMTLGYADHDETTFLAENIGISIGWQDGGLHDVLFGVAAIQNGQFGPVTWASTPVKIREILNRSTDPLKTPDEIAGTARVLDMTGLKDKIGRAVFEENGWTYPEYLYPTTADTKRRNIVETALEKTLFQVKEATRKGGTVTLDDLGRFEARWNEARTVRSVAFAPSPGFREGVRAGSILTDAQAQALNP